MGVKYDPSPLLAWVEKTARSSQLAAFRKDKGFTAEDAEVRRGFGGCSLLKRASFWIFVLVSTRES
jgi:hypothetical protein